MRKRIVAWQIIENEEKLTEAAHFSTGIYMVRAGRFSAKIVRQ